MRIVGLDPTTGHHALPASQLRMLTWKVRDPSLSPSQHFQEVRSDLFPQRRDNGIVVPDIEEGQRL
ncbi:hypothetical protein [Rhodococcus sp. UFZ-B548]|uniref:hypothetical protein n=1 Tax=Rhodococcus sp. UFZ-B548 TaxID=2742212 RepID=UPI001428C87B|nr:hypothetical protein [Rhodococcus sp. UFZ-B548]